MKGPQTLSQISETPMRPSTPSPSPINKEAAEKAAQEEIEKQRGLERAEIEKRNPHACLVLEFTKAAIALR